MKKTVFAFLSLVFALALFSLTVFADDEGHIQRKNVDTYWKYFSDTKTLYVYSDTSEYNETGTWNDEGSWGEYKDEIEHLYLVGKYYKTSWNAFEDHTALRTVTGAANVTSAYSFKGCTNLESVNCDIPGHAENLAGQIEKFAFLGTKIKTVRLTGTLKDATIFPRNVIIFAEEGSSSYKSASELGYTVYPDAEYIFNVNANGITYTESVKAGTSLEFPVICGKNMVLYTDAECTVPYDKEFALEDATLYGKIVFEDIGLDLRRSESQGLRAKYRVYDENVSALGYEIVEYGAIALPKTHLESRLNMSTGGINKVTVFRDGDLVGILSDSMIEGTSTYVVTAVGYGEGEVLAERAEQEILFRGYLVLRDKNSGEEFTVYTDKGCESLASVAQDLSDRGLIPEEEKSFALASLDAGALPSYMYTREDLMAVMTDVYNLEGQYMPGELVSGNLSSMLERYYAYCGRYPAIISYDLKDNPLYIQDNVDECIEYARMGGIITLSYHMACPCLSHDDDEIRTGEFKWCNGEGGKGAFKALVTKGNPMNRRFNLILDEAAGVLKKFDDAGVPILWRPFHEMTGDWFWWCVNQWNYRGGTVPGERFIELWKYMYTYYTEEWGLDNLIWVYAPSPYDGNPTVHSDGHLSASDFRTCYPGDEFVDIVGIDWYTATYNEKAKASYDYFAEITDKIFAITECGNGGTPGYSALAQIALMNKTMENGVKICYTLNWSSTQSAMRAGNFSDFMADPSVLTLDEVKPIFDKNHAKQ